MFTLDFLIVVLICWGIIKVVRAINAPSLPTRGAQGPVQRSTDRTEGHPEPVRGKIVDATFEEIE